MARWRGVRRGQIFDIADPRRAVADLDALAQHIVAPSVAHRVRRAVGSPGAQPVASVRRTASIDDTLVKSISDVVG